HRDTENTEVAQRNQYVGTFCAKLQKGTKTHKGISSLLCFLCLFASISESAVRRRPLPRPRGGNRVPDRSGKLQSQSRLRAGPESTPLTRGLPRISATHDGSAARRTTGQRKSFRRSNASLRESV